MKPHRHRMALGFLAQWPFGEGTLEIEQAQISVVLCGSSETRYTVYCFEDDDFDEELPVYEEMEEAPEYTEEKQ